MRGFEVILGDGNETFVDGVAHFRRGRTKHAKCEPQHASSSINLRITNATRLGELSFGAKHVAALQVNSAPSGEQRFSLCADQLFVVDELVD